MRILITGAAGFIGSHLVEYYLNRNAEIIGVDDLSSGSEKNIEPFKSNTRFTFDVANILTWKGLDKAIQWADLIFHMAAVIGVKRVIAEPIQVEETNIIGTDKILKAMSHHRSKATIVIASTSSVYGATKKRMLSENDSLVIEPPSQHSLSCYAISKLADEALAFGYSREKNIASIIIRLFNVIGPRQTGRYGMVVPRFVQQACRNEPITVFGDGSQTRSFCDVRDAINMINGLVENIKSRGEVFNVGHSDEITILELAKLVKKQTKSQSDIIFVPYKEAYGIDFTDIKQRVPDVKKCLALTQYQYKWTLIQTIDDLTDRFRQTVKEKAVEK